MLPSNMNTGLFSQSDKGASIYHFIFHLYFSFIVSFIKLSFISIEMHKETICFSLITLHLFIYLFYQLQEEIRRKKSFIFDHFNNNNNKCTYLLKFIASFPS